MGNKYMETVNRGTVQSLYQYVAGQSVSVSPLVKTVMGTSMRYAKSKNIISANPTEGVHMPKCVRKKKYREREIDVAKTLNEEQVERLIEGSKGTPVYMQILFAVMMGLRWGEINGLKYSDVDYIHRKLKVQRQLGKKPNTEKEDVPPKMLTKQEIKLKTKSSYRELDIPDMVFEAILEQRKIYEKNRRRRKSEFRDTDYICCSTYGNPRSKSFHYPYYKKILAEQGLPNIRFHDLRSTYATILMKNNFNLKGISNMLGHSKEIISADVYGDTKEIIADCLDVLQPFIVS
jgi:integrase